MPNCPRDLVLVEPDPDVPPPPLHLIPGVVEVVQIDSAAIDEQLAAEVDAHVGASMGHRWDRRTRANVWGDCFVDEKYPCR